MSLTADSSGRRRRGATLEKALLDATWEELVEKGYDGLTIESVAERAQTARAVIYRRWPSKPELVRAAHDDLVAGRSRAEIAAAFHEGVAEAAARACELAGSPRTVVLSGGSFQNVRLLRSTRSRLEERGFQVLTHRRIPPNDGGISYGQAAVAARRMM